MQPQVLGTEGADERPHPWFDHTEPAGHPERHRRRHRGRRPGDRQDHARARRPLREQVELDSIDWVNVIETLCERLQVDIPEAEYGRLTTIDSIAACVEARRQARASGEQAAPSAASAEDLPSCAMSSIARA